MLWPQTLDSIPARLFLTRDDAHSTIGPILRAAPSSKCILQAPRAKGSSLPYSMTATVGVPVRLQAWHCSWARGANEMFGTSLEDILLQVTFAKYWM